MSSKSYLKTLVGAHVRVLRESRNFSKKRLADEVDVEGPTIQRWEDGTHLPDAEKIERMAVLFGVHPTFFFRDDIPLRLPEPSVEKALHVLADALERLKELESRERPDSLLTEIRELIATPKGRAKIEAVVKAAKDEDWDAEAATKREKKASK